MSNHWDNDALDVLREYWLDTDPTVSNDVRFCTSGVAVSNGTVSVRVKLLVDNWRMTALNGGTVVQVQTKTNLQDAAWRRTADLPVDGGTFDVNGEAVVRTNLSDRSLFLRAVVSP
jgi:hypothetical protein